MSDITITISSVQDGAEGSKYKRLQRQTIHMRNAETPKSAATTQPNSAETGGEKDEADLDNRKRPGEGGACNTKGPHDEDGTGSSKRACHDSACIATSRPRRTMKPVDRYEPQEICNDDFADSDYDSCDSDD